MTNLRRKLSTVFVALGLLGLLVVGVTSYTVVQWRGSEEEQARHYTRSLRLQEVRALSFEAYKEVPDAVIGGDQDARQDYERRLAPIGSAFEEWASLADDDDERDEVALVRAAAEELQASAERVFDLVDRGQRDEAVTTLEQVEEAVFEPFDELTTRAVATDRAKREVVRADAADARRAATLTLAVAALGVVSLVLLIAAYLAGGVFGPVHRLHENVRRLAAGESEVRFDEEGDGEIGEVNRELNRLTTSWSHGGTKRSAGDCDPVGDAQLMLTRMMDSLREDAVRLQELLSEPAAAEAGSGLLSRIETTRIAVARIGALAHPVELDLTAVDPLVLLHEVMDRAGDEVIRRRASTRIDVDDPLNAPLLDRARIRETLSELVRNALQALPARGGTLQLRARSDADGGIVFEVEDDGSGVTEEDLAWLYDGSDRPSDTRGVGLRLATSIVEQHGGRLVIETRPGAGTIARVLLPPPDRSSPDPNGDRPPGRSSALAPDPTKDSR